MGEGIADAIGMEGVRPKMTAEDSAKGLLEQVSGLTSFSVALFIRRCLELTWAGRRLMASRWRTLEGSGRTMGRHYLGRKMRGR
jgi:hypothetical protein